MVKAGKVLAVPNLVESDEVLQRIEVPFASLSFQAVAKFTRVSQVSL